MRLSYFSIAVSCTFLISFTSANSLQSTVLDLLVIFGDEVQIVILSII